MQSDGTDAPPSGRNPPALPARMSALARASAIVGAVSATLSCLGGGIGGPLAVLLGMIALERIRASAGGLRGRGVAWTGIALGVVSLGLTFLFQWGLTSVQGSLNSQLDSDIRTTFAAIDDAGGREALGKWAPAQGTVLTAEEIEAFARTTNERYGSFSSYSVSSEVRRPNFTTGSHTLELAVKLDFAQASVPAVVVAKILPTATDIMPRMLLESISIEDPERGVIRLGGAKSPTSDSSPTDAAEKVQEDTTTIEADSAKEGAP
jgi:hypothetical protein